MQSSVVHFFSDAGREWNLAESGKKKDKDPVLELSLSVKKQLGYL